MRKVQLDKIAKYHRALSDVTRLRIVFLLKDGEMHGQALAESLQVSAPTVTHHMAKLREASLVESRRDKNTIYFRLIDQQFVNYAKASLHLISGDEQRTLTEQEQEEDNNFRLAVLQAFFTTEGKLKQMPAKYKKKLIVLEKLIESFQLGKLYTEQEVNEIIRVYYDDIATVRREFIMQSFMSREHDKYEVNPKQMWVNWQHIS